LIEDSMGIRFQQKRDTAANWTTNDTVLLAAEIGYETDTGKLKIGDGTTAWTSLAYAVAGSVAEYVTEYGALEVTE